MYVHWISQHIELGDKIMIIFWFLVSNFEKNFLKFQGEKLSSLGQDIDLRRCSSDPAYTRDIVHGLAM